MHRLVNKKKEINKKKMNTQNYSLKIIPEKRAKKYRFGRQLYFSFVGGRVVHSLL